MEKRLLLSLSLLAGLLLAISWPARGIPFITFVAFIPLLMIDDKIIRNRQDFGKYSMLLYAWLSFIVFNALTTWWIYFASLPGLLMAVLLNSLFMAIPVALMHALRRTLPANQGQFSLVILWLTFEYLHLDWDLSWSWLNLGNVFATLPSWVQWYEYTGTLGGTAWILITNIVLYNLIKTYKTPLQTIKVERRLDTENQEGKKQIEIFLKNRQQYQILKKRSLLGFVALLVLLIPAVISFHIGKNYEESVDPVEIIIVQPARDPWIRPVNILQEREWTDKLIHLANRKVTAETRFILAPEAALPAGMWINNMERNYGFTALSGHAALSDSITWIAGSMMYQVYPDKENASPTSRPLHGTDQYYDVYNAALLVNSRGEVDRYSKSRLVPGIERMPFARYLGPVGKLVERFGGTAGSMGVQDEPSVFLGMDGTKVAPVICYESIYGEYVNGFIRRGAHLIFVITNDGWWKNTPGYKQHNQYARLRAVETRRSIARAAKTGISSFIDQKGEFIEQTSWWDETSIRQTLQKNDKLTFYTRNGDYLGRLSFFLSVLLIFYLISQSLIRARGKKA
jgi:apolipoprotein N-acyltransferase